MNLLKRAWNKYLENKKRAREVMKITRSFQTSFKCPKCKSSLSQISYSKFIDTRYFCKKCGYEGMAKL